MLRAPESPKLAAEKDVAEVPFGTVRAQTVNRLTSTMRRGRERRLRRNRRPTGVAEGI